MSTAHYTYQCRPSGLEETLEAARARAKQSSAEVHVLETFRDGHQRRHRVAPDGHVTVDPR